LQNPVDDLKALGDATRFEIVRLLLHHDYCVCSLSRQLGVTESAVSQHLKILKEAGLVMANKRGYFTHYVVQRKKLALIGEALIAAAQTQAENHECYHGEMESHCCHTREK
jgi:Predicted transcriptional regulators